MGSEHHENLVRVELNEFDWKQYIAAQLEKQTSIQEDQTCVATPE